MDAMDRGVPHDGREHPTEHLGTARSRRAAIDAATRIYLDGGALDMSALAEELGVVIGDEPTLTEEGYADNPKRGRRRVLQIAGSHGTPVICTQGKVIPDLITWWCERDGILPDKSRNRKGSTWVLSLADGRLLAADHIGSALAANVVT